MFSQYLKQPANEYIQNLIEQLEADEGEGSPVTKDEFMSMLSRPESQQVYTKQLIKIATPRSVQIQNREHRDFLNVFMKEKRIKRGVKFLHTEKSLLETAEKQFGVDRQDIVSILMWESGLGEFTGKLRVFNVLMGQLLFLEPAQEHAIEQMIAEGAADSLTSEETLKRQEKRFARIKRRCVSNLVALLRQSKAKGADPLGQIGSWGGAIGYPQFMPASMAYAVDGDKDGAINLHTWPDAIMSVASYLKVRGKYSATDTARRKAIHSYNPIDSYVNGVVAFADEIMKRYNQGQ
jgi:membrane-bound lytic murein transglycosylase B